MSEFSFQDNNLSKSRRIFTKLNMCIDIVEICFGVAIGYILVEYLHMTEQWQGVIVSHFY